MSSERDRQQALVELGLLCASQHSLDVLLTEGARLVAQGVETERAKVLERRPSGELLVRAGVGWPPGIVGQMELPSNGDSQASYAVRTGEPVVVTDLPSETRFEPWPPFLQSGVKSGVNVLIQSGRELFGVLEADSTKERDYDEADIGFLQSAANLLGVALDRQRYEEERDHLLNVASHELGNPLALVLGFGERLRHQLESDSPDLERLRMCADEILQGATRMRRLLEQILDLGRIEQPHAAVIEPIDLDEVLHRVAAEAEQRHPSVRFEWLEESLPSVMGNLDAAYMLFANLVENAAKYSRLEPLVQLTLERTDANCVIRVRDRCGGIAGDDLDRLFDRYFRGHSANEFRGLGLGLFVAHRAAESLGWWVSVQNYPGEGCEFVVTIPASWPEGRGSQASRLPPSQ